MSYFTIYCDLDFLAEFNKRIPESRLEQTDGDRTWHKIHHFLGEQCVVVVNENQENLSADLLEKNPYLKYLINKRMVASNPALSINAVQFQESFSDQNPWKLYFVAQTEKTHETLSREHGIWFLCPESILETWERLAQYRSLNVKPNGTSSQDFQAWVDIQQFSQPLTALVVCDPYLFQTNQDDEDNTFPLILNLLPEKSEYVIDITILSINEKGRNIEDIRRGLENYIHEKKPLVNCNISILKAEIRNYHDRHIFMNYGFFKSGHSFSYLKKGKVDKTTTLDFVPMILPEYFSTALSKIKYLSELVQRTPNSIGVQQNLAGKKQNQLLDAV